jgi:hypothetical protein
VRRVLKILKVVRPEAILASEADLAAFVSSP